MKTYKYSRTRFLGNGKRFVTHTTRFYHNRKKWHIRNSYLGAMLIDKFKLYRHKFKKGKYIPGFYSEVEYVPPMVRLKGFKRR